MIDIDNIIERITSVNNQELDIINLNSLISSQVLAHNSSYEFLSLPSGRAHYRLLSFISSLFDNCTIFDVGTLACRSAIALSTNKNNKVISYDVEQNLNTNPVLKNVDFVLGDTTKDARLIESPLIMLDVNHDGLYEDVFYNHLHTINWKGILLLDDIYLNEPMKKFWNSITEEKYDITNVGAWAGTGLVYFK